MRRGSSTHPQSSQAQPIVGPGGAHACVAGVVTLVTILCLNLSHPSQAHAQTTTSPGVSRVTADAKGILGLGIIGAELGFIVPALTGLHETWAFIVFPVVGAAGGGIAGYFLLEQGGNANPELAVAMFAVGLGLIVPTLVGTLALTANDGESAQPQEGVEGQLGSARRQLERHGGVGLVRYGRAGLGLGIPGLSATPRYLAEEQARLALPQRYDVQVPLVSATF